MHLCYIESALEMRVCVIHDLTQVCPLAGVSVAPLPDARRPHDRGCQESAGE